MFQEMLYFRIFAVTLEDDISLYKKGNFYSSCIVRHASNQPRMTASRGMASQHI